MVVLGSVIYSDALKYLDDFIDSINEQTYKEFDVLLVNDDIDQIILQQRIKKINSKNIIIIDQTKERKSPAQLRVVLLVEAKKRGYDLLVLGDCDDTFSKNRIYNIEQCYSKNKEYTFYYNDLIMQNGKMAIYGMPNLTYSIEDILQYNYLGLSNNAINMGKISVEWIESLKECESFVFDWYFFSRLLVMNLKGLYVKNAYTIYRIHQNNYVGLNQRSREVISKELMVKKQHYKSLMKYNRKINDMYEKIKDMTVEDVPLSMAKTSFWWSNIKLKEEG